MPPTHRLLPRLVAKERPLDVVLVGVGGTGASVLGGLPALDQSLRAFGHPGIQVTVFDPDVVSESNCARQPFARCEIGSPKASTLVSRINAFYGTRWRAYVEAVSSATKSLGDADLVIGAVDSRAARAAIHEATQHLSFQNAYWLDYGNTSSSGQFILGTRDGVLPTVATKYPELIDPRQDDPTVPSCSAREALLSQGAFVNQALAQSGLAMLARLFRDGELSYHGVHMNFATGQSAAIAVPEVATPRSRTPHSTRRSRART